MGFGGAILLPEPLYQAAIFYHLDRGVALLWPLAHAEFWPAIGPASRAFNDVPAMVHRGVGDPAAMGQPDVCWRKGARGGAGLVHDLPAGLELFWSLPTGRAIGIGSAGVFAHRHCQRGDGAEFFSLPPETSVYRRDFAIARFFALGRVHAGLSFFGKFRGPYQCGAFYFRRAATHAGGEHDRAGAGRGARTAS